MRTFLVVMGIWAVNAYQQVHPENKHPEPPLELCLVIGAGMAAIQDIKEIMK